MVDSHLVMNTLNLMAAREFKEHGTECDLLFALSDYLQQAFNRKAQTPTVVDAELSLLKTQLALLAMFSACTLDLTIEPGSALNRTIRTGQLSHVAYKLLSLPDRQESRKTRMTIALTATEMPHALRVVMTLHEAGNAEPFDLLIAQERLGPILLETVLQSAVHGPVQWSQQHPRHLELIYFLEYSS